MKLASMDDGVFRVSCSALSVVKGTFSRVSRGMRTALGLMNWVWTMSARSS